IRRSRSRVRGQRRRLRRPARPRPAAPPAPPHRWQRRRLRLHRRRMLPPPRRRGTVNPTAPAPAHPQVSPAARADFDRVVSYMRAGKTVEAQLGFKQLSLQYPQFAAPLVNLAILQRNDGHLEQAEETLKSAVAHERGSAVAWNELG